MYTNVTSFTTCVQHDAIKEMEKKKKKTFIKSSLISQESQKYFKRWIIPMKSYIMSLKHFFD